MSREAMKLALEALEKVITAFGPGLTLQQKAATALRQALVEPEQKSDPSAWHGWVLREVLFDNGEPIGHREPEQEPVAWANSFDLQNFDMKVRTGPDLHHTVPLYTAPSKQWVGLTDEEIDECERLAAIRYQRHKYSVRGQIITPADGLEWHFAQAIEAKLKEKNGG